MSVKADLLLESKGEHIVISFKKLSQQFVDIFKKRGARIIFVSEREKKKTVVQKVFYALNIPFCSDEFKFSIPERGNNPSVTIYLPAIKTTKDKSTSYLTNIDIDHKIHGLLHKKRGVNLIKY
jgi:acid phosphatase class B